MVGQAKAARAFEVLRPNLRFPLCKSVTFRCLAELPAHKIADKILPYADETAD